MSNSLHQVLRCDTTRPDGTRCGSYLVGAAGKSLPEVRDDARAKGWRFKPGIPYRHVNATDTCPGCVK